MNSPLKLFLTVLLCCSLLSCSYLRDEDTCAYVEIVGPVDAALVEVINNLMTLENGWFTNDSRRNNAKRLFVILDQLDLLKEHFEDKTEDLVNDKVEELHELMLKKIDTTIELGEYFELKFTEWLAEDVPKEEIEQCLEKFKTFRWQFKKHQEETRDIFNKILVYLVACE